MVTNMDVSQVLSVLLVGLTVGAVLGWLAVRARYAGALAARQAESSLLTQQLRQVQAQVAHDQEVAAALGPVRDTLGRVEHQVAMMERDRVQQFGQLGERLAQVHQSASELRDQTASLAGSLNSSAVRGVWGENQLRRILEHAGMLARCDFAEQVRARTDHDDQVRPDVVVQLPGGRSLVIDAKTPLRAFLSAQADGISASERAQLLSQHAVAVRHHVDALAAKSYWSAFRQTPDMVVCFIPSDAILAAALSADPALFDDAQARRVILASPSTLLALLRAVAFGWQQQAVTENAQELLALGSELYSRLSTMAGHVTRLGGSLRRSVESYNAMIGAMESRVLVTARRIHDLELADAPVPALSPVEVAPRPLTSTELIDASQGPERLASAG